MYPSSASPPASPSPALVTGDVFSRGAWVLLLSWADYCGWSSCFTLRGSGRRRLASDTFTGARKSQLSVTMVTTRAGGRL